MVVMKTGKTEATKGRAGHDRATDQMFNNVFFFSLSPFPLFMLYA
jgi:hypothetical protein